jgi:hypothetical protein
MSPVDANDVVDGDMMHAASDVDGAGGDGSDATGAHIVSALSNARAMAAKAGRAALEKTDGGAADGGN